MARNLVNGEYVGKDRVIRSYTAWCRLPTDEMLCPYRLPSSAPFIPQGELLEFEEPKLYGLWNGKRWFVDGLGAVFHTPYVQIARMQLKDAYEPNIWAIRIIGPDGEPQELECP